MQARLFCKTGQLAGASFTITGDASIGKAADNAIQLYPEIVSSHHARIYFDSKRGCYVLDDLDSRNGTRIDGASVHGTALLDRLNVITFANKFDFVFQVLDEAAQKRAPKVASPAKHSPAPAEKGVAPKSPVPTPSVPPKIDAAGAGKTVFGDAFEAMPNIPGGTAAADDAKSASAGKTVFGDGFEAMPNIPGGAGAADDAKSASAGKTMLDDAWGAPPIPGDAVRPAPEPVPAARRYRLALIAIDGTTTATFPLKDGENSIGRDPRSDVTIEDGSMSRAHATIVIAGGEARIRDLGSKNGTFVGEARVHDDMALAPGSDVRFGLATLKFLVDI
ncbi:MAG: FHA domain-containing protein [Ignavibacteria bacterium]|nr:FHA domain-containing protein [Ignavibacteria bacterium]